MKLRELFESAHHKATAAFCFGRFNPPHQGHAQVWDAVKHAGQHWYIGTNPGTIGPNDPLPFDVKTAWMAAIDPSIQGHILGETSIVTLAARIYNDVGDGATIAYVTDATDWAWSGKLLKQYNGVQGPHGYYKFGSIEWMESPRVMSATVLRQDVIDGHEDKFYADAGVDPSLKVNSISFYETVQQYLMPFKQAKDEKEAAKAEKLRMKQEKEAAKAAKSAAKVAKGPARELAEAANAAQQAAIAVNMKKHHKKPKRLSEHLDEMFTDRFTKKLISESDIPADLKRLGKHGHDIVASLKGGMSLPGISQNKSNGSPYQGYRFGIAMASADGKGTLRTPAAGAMAGDNLLSVYTQEEYEMVKQAAKETLSGPIRKLSDMASREAADTHTASPVSKRKPNKYGI